MMDKEVGTIFIAIAEKLDRIAKNHYGSHDDDPSMDGAALALDYISDAIKSTIDDNRENTNANKS